MQISLTFRHMEATDAMKELVKEKVAKVKKFIPGPLEATVVLSVERYIHSCDMTIVSNGNTYTGHDETDDMYTSIDNVITKIERQIDRSKGKARASRTANP